MLMNNGSLAFRVLNYAVRKGKETGQGFLFKKPQYSEPILDAIASIKRQNKTETIFVIGNGPSLNRQNLDHLSTEFTIASNAFYLIYERINWRPTIFTIEDQLIVDDNIDFFNSDEYSWKFVPYDLSPKISNNSKTVYLNFLRSYRHWSRAGWPYFSQNIVDRCYWGGTVSYLSLQLAAAFRPKRIILLGTDLSYTIPMSVKRDGINLRSTEDDVNHFSPQYFGAGKKWHIPEVERMQHAFQVAYKNLSSMDIELLNATDGGDLKNVPRVDYERLFV